MSPLTRFLDRWSRLKRAAPADAAAGSALPPLETLDADADLRAYLREEAGEALRRQALKKIFSDPRLNVMDGLDVYIDDYSIADPIPAEMLAQLNQARFLWADEAVGDSGAAPAGNVAATAGPTLAAAAEQAVSGEAAAGIEKEKQTP